MYFQFDTYTHPANEVDMTMMQQNRQFSPRNRHTFVRKTLTLNGHFCTSGEAAIKLAIEDLEDAYLPTKFGSAGLLHSDGTRSAHYLDEPSSLNGVRVLTLDYPKEEGGEYVTGRAYRIVMQADYLANPLLDNTYLWEQTISMHGTGGRDWEYVPQYYGPPIIQINANQTPQHFIQSGQSVGVTNFTPLPIRLFDETYEHKNRRIIEYGTAMKPGVNKHMFYPLKWTYFFSLPAATFEDGVRPINPN